MEHADMAAEFPSDDVEAFKNSGNMVFSVYHIDKLKEGCKAPQVCRGNIGQVR